MSVAAPPTNALLELIDPLGAIAIGGTVLELQAGQVLVQSGEPEAHVYFPVTAVLSLMSTMESGDSCESALVGREGMVGLAGVFGASDSSTSCVVQIGGTCLRASANAVRAARHGNATVSDAIDRYTTARLIQVAQISACNRLHHIGSRLARWLLMLHDRIDRDHLQLSQHTMASSLGVHRPTIAVELQRLHQSGAIFYRSRIVKIIDRPRLESLACECHHALHREYVSLFRALDAPHPPIADAGGGAAIEVLRGIAGRLLMASMQEQAARERAEASDRAKDHFLAMVSHELRGPLQAILGWCALAKAPNPPPGAIEVIERNARAQMVLIEDLIDSARMNTDSMRISPREVDPVRIVETVIESVRPAAEAKQVSLRLNVLNELGPVVADADRLHQVMTNVLLNSVKFSPAGASIETEVSGGNGSIELRVIDHGDGVPPEMLPHVFERFWQGPVAGERRRQGLGLGLNIAQSLVKLHGGTIQLTSAGTGKGTICTITLPRGRSTRSADPPAAPR